MSDEYYDIQCPTCASEGRDSKKDNLRVYKNTGIGYCHAGGHGYVKHEILKDIERPALEPQNTTGLLDGYYSDLLTRGIKQKTCQFYGYQVNKKKQVHIANYYNESGQCVMQQLRDKEKNFPVLGDKSFNSMLYGMWLFGPDKRVFCTITEGQIDCLSVAQAFDCKYPVVSLPNGAGCAKAVLERHRKYLEGFKYIVLAFDNDDAGKKATEECLKILGPGHVRIARWPVKDANELLIDGKVETIRKVIYNAVEYIPSPILTGPGLLDCLRGHTQKTREWPWPMANAVIEPIHIPGIYTFAALPGVGKTVVMADLIRDCIKKGEKVGSISLEESTQKHILKITDMVTGSNLRGIKNRPLTEEEVQLAKPISESIVTYDHHEYGSGLNEILENLPYIAQSLKCEFIIFDNLSFSATNDPDDERKNLDKAMLRLKDSSTKHQYTLFNICHLNDDKEDFRDATMRGSRGMMMYSDYVIYLGRNTETQEQSERNTLTFYVKKDRESGEDTGKSFDLYYDPKTRTFVD